jgi:transcription elongation factor GreA
MAKQVVLTDEGLRKLEDELEHLKTESRKEIADKIKTALSFGDLSENSEYDEAKNEQAMVEARIVQLETILKNVKIIDEDDIKTDVVSIGTKVKLLDIEFNEEMDFHIVGSTESDPNKNRISDESPVGIALMGHKIGETITTNSPGGAVTLKILKITK